MAKGWRVRALVRDPATPAAQALHQVGVQVIQGDNEDRASLEAAMQGIYGVFSVQPAIYGEEREIRQGKNIADAARGAAVEHFVYSSAQSADNLSNSKGEVERYIRELDLKASILRPALFMVDVIGPIFGVPQGTFTTAIKPDRAIRLIATDDIGAFAAIAFEHPDSYRDRTIEIAGDALTPPQIAAAISYATGRSITYVQLAIETVRQQNAHYARVFDFLNKTTYEDDLPELRGWNPALISFMTWLERENKDKEA